MTLPLRTRIDRLLTRYMPGYGRVAWAWYRWRNRTSPREFHPGDVVIWAPSHDIYAGTTEVQRINWYSRLGYGAATRPLFVYVCPINACNLVPGVRMDSGHCILIELGTGRIEWMRHPDDFRYATNEEF